MKIKNSILGAFFYGILILIFTLALIFFHFNTTVVVIDNRSLAGPLFNLLEALHVYIQAVVYIVYYPGEYPGECLEIRRVHIRGYLFEILFCGLVFFRFSGFEMSPICSASFVSFRVVFIIQSFFLIGALEMFLPSCAILCLEFVFNLFGSVFDKAAL